MTSATPGTRPTVRLVGPPPTGEAIPDGRGRLDPVALFLLAASLVPLVGLAVLGHWSDRELGVAAALAILSLWCLADPD